MSSLAPHNAAVPQSCDLAIVGGGIVGLAVARDLLMRNPRASLCVLERESDVATHQTGHSSGVIHAGIYYRPGSLKARLCVQGARELFDYCDQRGIASEACGKVILATDASELHRLEELERRGKANGVPGLRQIDAARVAEIEPHARAIAALHSPHTGICDFPAVALSFAEDVRAGGGTIATSCEVKHVEVRPRSLCLVHTRGTLEAGHAIFCAGAWADRL
ncbi:MAG: (S)-2-hydroxyglutarate dehydrogenase, partial [Solirubrobacteraceae bacterium]|nr:(S)-2-hydroxyglutarate dehydrogenase [Solirubrobacteraceae bacterium]